MPISLLFRRFLSNSSWLVGANVASAACGFLQAIILARLLGVDHYGILALVLSITTTVYALLESRVWEAAIKFVIEFRENGDKLRATAAVKLCLLVDAFTGILSFAILILGAKIFAGWFFKDLAGAGLLQLYAISVLITIPYSTCSALLRIGNRFDWLSYQSAGSAVLRLIGALIVFLLQGDIKGVLFVYLISSAAGTILLIAFARRTARELELDHWNASPLTAMRGHFKRMIRFLFYSNLNGTSRMITSRADTLILGWFSTPGVVGIYKLAKTFIEPINMIGTSLYTALYPEISKLVAQKDFQQIRSFRRKVSVTTAGIIVPLCFGVTIAAPTLIPFFFSEKFFGAILLTQIMVWQVVWVPFTWLPPFLLAMERAGTVAALNYLDAMIYLILLLALVPFFGASGAAWGTLIRFVVALMIGLAVVAHVEKRMAAPALLESAPTKA